MTQKDYIVIAGALRKAHKIAADRPMPYASYVMQNVESVVAMLAAALHEDNPRFDTQHFVEVVTGQRELNSHPKRKLVRL